MELDLVKFLKEQREFSENTFGPGKRFKGCMDHIKKELEEIEEDPSDLEEWIDLILLSFDGARRQGYSEFDIVNKLVYKLYKNINRKWPDWRNVPDDQAIEHIDE